MSALQAAVLGIVQGLTEFLPVSSSAHLVVIPKLAGWPDQGLAYDVALHWGTLFAVVVYFWKDLINIAKDGFTRADSIDRRLFDGLIIATLPGVIAGLAFGDFIETHFRTADRVGISLAFFGILLGLADRFGKKERGADTISLKDCALIGLSQALAIIPGVSRSGITMTAGLALGLKRVDAARFSFLMAVPIVAGAGVLKFKDLLAGGIDATFFLGVGLSAVSGLLAIGGLMRYLKNASFTVFAIYRVLWGGFLIWFTVSK
ncbi:MAG: UDP-diphosphatase [Elusimicrobia bacterium]|nr:MAG: UDP-diphosphatase [Elusimicrobiota bacterium]